jgi:hypothetical protein
MKMKKLLLCICTAGAVVTTTSGFAAPQGTAATITTAKIICMASLTGDVPLVTVTGATQQKGMESSWFITNTSSVKNLKITRVDSYGMDGKLLTSLTPVTNPTLKEETGGFFDWTVKPRQLVRFPHDNSMIYPANGVVGTSPELVRWYNVVFTVKAENGSISAPLATTGMVERTEDLTVTPATHFVLSRTRNECKYMM